MSMPPEIYFQKEFGILINTVDALSSTVKTTIDTASESVTIYGYHHFFSVSDPARITGRTGRTHGARMVRIPAMNEISTREVIVNKRRNRIHKIMYDMPYNGTISIESTYRYFVTINPSTISENFRLTTFL